jgi:squalene-hopene/tetraprenyl-beta-curcumene cyclase
MNPSATTAKETSNSEIRNPDQDQSEQIKMETLDKAIEQSKNYLLSRQDSEGFWIDELESNATITAELIFLMHFVGKINEETQKKCVQYLLNEQREDGSWAIYYDAPGCMSTTVESYLAMKMAGVSHDHPQLVKAKEFVLNNGGINKSRVFTKIFLAMFGQISWQHIPAMPLELVLMPDWFPFNIYEMSSWSRGVIVPLLIVCAHHPVHEVPYEKGVSELIANPDEDFSVSWAPGSINTHNAFILLDKTIKWVGKFSFKPFRKKAIKTAIKWVLDHQEDQGDWAGIQPAMFNSVLALKLSDYKDDDPIVVKAWEAIDRFCIYKGDSIVMQSCISPLWDTGIACNALMDAGLPKDHPAMIKAVKFFIRKQVVKRGDWQVKNPNAKPGGWAFEFYNELYPDTDDTAEILMAINSIEFPDIRQKLKESQRALSWLLSMQSKNGGWGAFDQDNDQELFNAIPFADHNAMLDPPTSDVTARILWLLGILGYSAEHPQVKKAINFLKNEQENDGSWFGRWGVNYIYGTFLTLNGLHSIGEDMKKGNIVKAAQWLKSKQNQDGGWGETCASYGDKKLAGVGESTASQTAWALLGLTVAGEAGSDQVTKGAEFLIKNQNKEGTWYEPQFTGTGFPEHFYIKYHMYQHYFPLMALARYRHATQNNNLEPRKENLIKCSNFPKLS